VDSQHRATVAFALCGSALREAALRAHVADEEERARLWPEAVETYSGYRGDQERIGREIPLVVLKPR